MTLNPNVLREQLLPWKVCARFAKDLATSEKGGKFKARAKGGKDLATSEKGGKFKARAKGGNDLAAGEKGGKDFDAGN